MTITREEFFRRLPGALDGLQFERADGLVEAHGNGKSLRIVVSEQTARRLASLVLPVLRVRLEFRGYDEEHRKAFLRRFDLCYQKGGG